MKKILYAVALLLVLCVGCNQQQDEINKELTNATVESIWGYVEDSVYEDPDSVEALMKGAQENAKNLKEYLENR